MTTNLLITDDANYEAIKARAEAWRDSNGLFDIDEAVIATEAVIEFTLNEMGLTVYTHRHDESLMTRMDEWFGGLSKESRENWCEAGACGCMGCVNHDAYKNGVTKHQWRIWVLDRTPGLAELWAERDAYWARIRAEREEEDRVRRERATARLNLNTL
jgi:hypothetical protein